MQARLNSSQPAMDCWAHMRKWHGKPATDEHLGFAKLENKLSHKSEISNPAAVAASIGRKNMARLRWRRSPPPAAMGAQGVGRTKVAESLLLPVRIS